MLLKNSAFIAALSVLHPMAASAWEHEMQRGVDLYRVVDGDTAISLVCDPRSVYGTTESAVLIELGSEFDIDADASFRFPDGILVQGHFVRGRIAKAETQGGAWEPLLTGFRAHSSVEVTVNDQTLDVDLGEPKVFTCL